MPELHISPSEIFPRLDFEPPPRPGASVAEWVAYRARHPRPALPAPPAPMAPAAPPTQWPPIPPHLLKRKDPPPPPSAPAPIPIPADMQAEADAILKAMRANRVGIVRRIIAETAREFEICVFELLSGRRNIAFVTPRHLARLISTRNTTMSLPQIGAIFHCDHTTVLHSIRRARELIANPEIAARVEAIEARIAPGTESVVT